MADRYFFFLVTGFSSPVDLHWRRTVQLHFFIHHYSIDYPCTIGLSILQMMNDCCLPAGPGYFGERQRGICRGMLQVTRLMKGQEKV